VCAFIGVANPEFIAADGVRIGPEQHERALAGALQAAAELAAA
jgi:FMN-dependent NADH-azoreductase